MSCNVIKFYDEQHEKLYKEILGRMKSKDCYHQSAAYLLSLDNDCFRHIRDIFDFEDDCVKLDSVNKSWQTGSSGRTTRLLLNLWNGYCYSEDEDGNDVVDRRYVVDDIFCCLYAPYFYEAIKLRYPECVRG